MELAGAALTYVDGKCNPSIVTDIVGLSGYLESFDWRQNESLKNGLHSADLSNGLLACLNGFSGGQRPLVRD